MWNAASNRFGRSSLLGCEPGDPNVSPYAAAAQARDLSGLPPTYVATGSLDLFLDENIEYTAGPPGEHPLDAGHGSKGRHSSPAPLRMTPGCPFDCLARVWK